MTQASAALRVFQEAWWLDVASAGRIETVEVRWDGRVVGSLAFMPTRRNGTRRLVMPSYTRALGPVFTLPPSGVPRRYQNMRRVTAELVAKLPRHDLFEQVLDPRDESAFAFSLAGMTVTQDFTFVIPSQWTEPEVLAQCDQKTRNIARSASRRCSVDEVDSLDTFIMLSSAERAAGFNTNDFDLLGNIVEACLQRGCCHLLVARDTEGRPIAATVLLRDLDCLYFWLSARDHRCQSGGANTMLVMRSMELARRCGSDLDLDGYATAAGGRFYAGFGGRCLVRPKVARSGWRRDAIVLLRNSISACTGRVA